MLETESTLEKKIEALRAVLAASGKVAVAFSGGVDSALLLRAAKDGAAAVCALFVDSVFVGADERRAAGALAGEIGVPLRAVPFAPLPEPAIRVNDPERCYHCKRSLMRLVVAAARAEGCDTVMDGTNRDDLGDYRPGLRALGELGIVSPLAEAGFTKADVRELSRRFGLSGHDRPAAACLASRIPYGTPLTEAALRRVDAAESFLREHGFTAVRVRSLGDMACIELGGEELDGLSLDRARRETIAAALRDLGFVRVALDIEGYRRGSLNP